MFRLAVQSAPKSGEVWCEGARIAIEHALAHVGAATLRVGSAAFDRISDAYACLAEAQVCFEFILYMHVSLHFVHYR